MMEARLAKRFAPGPDSFEFLLDFEFQARPGITALFGPAGTGKTLTLDAISGFLQPDVGRILLDDRILFDAASGVNLPPRQRNCGYILQNDALFPHMTVRQNLVFAADRLPRLERHRRVKDMLDRFQLSEVSARRPHELSAAVKQRCSLARALMGPPRLLLLDDPARRLDPPSRAELYRLLQEIRAEFQIPVILATFDLDACVSLADQMLILRDGRIAQKGRPREILDRPTSIEVARLLGISNIFQAEIMALDPGRNTSRLRFHDQELIGTYLPGHLLGDRVWVCVRAEDLRVTQQNGARPESNQIAAKLLRIAKKTQSVRLEFSGDISVELPWSEFERQKDGDNEEWLVEFPPAALRVL
jgi:molybdate transport system ATP-binding protein